MEVPWYPPTPNSWPGVCVIFVWMLYVRICSDNSPPTPPYFYSPFSVFCWEWGTLINYCSQFTEHMCVHIRTCKTELWYIYIYIYINIHKWERRENDGEDKEKRKERYIKWPKIEKNNINEHTHTHTYTHTHIYIYIYIYISSSTERLFRCISNPIYIYIYIYVYFKMDPLKDLYFLRFLIRRSIHLTFCHIYTLKKATSWKHTWM